MKKSAKISKCGKYRTFLSRVWEPGRPICYFIMLNPSTADAEYDDPTIRRCISFAKREGCGELRVVNLFTLRTTYPPELLMHDDPVGQNADDPIDAMFQFLPRDAIIIAGWGSPATKVAWFVQMYNDRVASILDKAYLNGRQIHCLAINKNGSPKHPLYVKGDAPLIKFNKKDFIS